MTRTIPICFFYEADAGYELGDGDRRMRDVAQAIVLDEDRVELRSHITFVPLGPGDIVRIDEEQVVQSVDFLERLYTYEVEFHLPRDGVVAGEPLPADHPAVVKIKALLEEWRRDAWVTQNTTFSALVSAQDQKWLNDKVLCHKFVVAHTIVRTPSFRCDWEIARHHPDLDGMRIGPWT